MTAKRPDPEQGRWHQRVATPDHQDRERDRRRDTDAQGNERGRVGPSLLLAPDEPEGDAPDRDGDDDRAQPVQPPRRVLVARLGHVADGRVQRQEHQGHVDQERDAATRTSRR